MGYLRSGVRAVRRGAGGGAAHGALEGSGQLRLGGGRGLLPPRRLLLCLGGRWCEGVGMWGGDVGCAS